jgi:hypothetical protein
MPPAANGIQREYDRSQPPDSKTEETIYNKGHRAMKESIRSMAILKAHPGREPELLTFLREFYTMMYTKQYSRDMLFRDLKQPGVLVNIRIWLSDEARNSAVHDPDVHRFWMKLPELATITNIYEELEAIFSTQEGVLEEDPEGRL